MIRPSNHHGILQVSLMRPIKMDDRMVAVEVLDGLPWSEGAGVAEDIVKERPNLWRRWCVSVVLACRWGRNDVERR